MKALLIFGATGGTGKEVLKQSLESGCSVTVIIRNLSSLQLRHPNLNIVQGDVLRPETFAKELAGKDAVISCLGTGSGTKPTVVYSAGINNIVKAMKDANVNRLICISAGALYVNKNMGLFIKSITRLVLQRIFKHIYSDMRIMENLVENTDIDWTIMRPPMLKNKSLSRKFRVSIQSHIRRPFSISRADLAYFILSILDAPETFKTKIEIAY